MKMLDPPGSAGAPCKGMLEAGWRHHLRIYNFLANRAAWELSCSLAGGRPELSCSLGAVVQPGSCQPGSSRAACQNAACQNEACQNAACQNAACQNAACQKAACQTARNRLEAGWRQDGGMLEAGWRQAGGRLEAGWRHHLRIYNFLANRAGWRPHLRIYRFLANRAAWELSCSLAGGRRAHHRIFSM